MSSTRSSGRAGRRRVDAQRRVKNGARGVHPRAGQSPGPARRRLRARPETMCRSARSTPVRPSDSSSSRARARTCPPRAAPGLRRPTSTTASASVTPERAKQQLAPAGRAGVVAAPGCGRSGGRPAALRERPAQARIDAADEGSGSRTPRHLEAGDVLHRGSRPWVRAARTAACSARSGGLRRPRDGPACPGPPPARRPAPGVGVGGGAEKLAAVARRRDRGELRPAGAESKPPVQGQAASSSAATARSRAGPAVASARGRRCPPRRRSRPTDSRADRCVAARARPCSTSSSRPSRRRAHRRTGRLRSWPVAARWPRWSRPARPRSAGRGKVFRFPATRSPGRA